MVDSPRIIIGICTFRRPDLLRQLLDAIARQSVASEAGHPTVFVVDNDPEGSASWVVSHQGLADVRVEHLGAGNIAVARNCVLDYALQSEQSFDLLAMIDDDECPSSDWLVELVACWRRSRADVVIGPVMGALCEDAPAWVRHGGYFDHTSPVPDGPLLEGISGNAMLFLPSIRGVGLRFDTDLGRAGGEDQLFFRLAARHGLSIRYAARAMVTETVPIERCSFRYLAARSFRMGNTLGLLDVHLPTKTWRQGLLRVAKSGYWIFSGIWRLVRHSPSGLRGLAPGLLRTIRGFGMVAGVAGVRYDFYRDRRHHHYANHRTSVGIESLQRAEADQSRRASRSLGLLGRDLHPRKLP